MGPGQGTKILVVDDDIDLTDLMSTHLSARGFETFQAYNGTQAIKMYEEHRPDVVLMDMIMPGIDGLVATRKIRTISASPTNPQIIMVTVKNSQDDVVQSIAYGANDFIHKPLEITLLLKKIENIIGSNT